MNNINLKRGEVEFPATFRISRNMTSNSVMVTTEDIDSDVNAEFRFGHTINSEESVPLLEGGNPVTMVITSVLKRAGRQLKDIFAPHLFIKFTLPEGVTKAASSLESTENITQLNAQPKATIDPNGSATSVSFEWGLTIAYGMPPVVIEQPVAIGAPLAIQTQITGLTPGEDYHWRVKMVNSSGTSYSEDQTFQALAVVAPTLSDEAFVPAANTATITAKVNPNGGETSVVLQFGPDNTYGGGANLANVPAGVVAVDVEQIMGELLPGTTYHYRFVLTNSAGVTEGQDKTLTTLALAPAILNDSHVSTPAATTCDVEAGVNPMGAQTALKIQYGLTNAYGTEIVCTESPLAAGNLPGIGSATIPALAANTTYYWRIVATNIIGTTNGPEQTFVTLAE